jgi:hypothetical protein
LSYDQRINYLTVKGGLAMAYSYTNSRGKTYILHGKSTPLKDGGTRTLYFFAKEEKEGALDAVPEGYEVSESRNGLPVLKRKS